MNVLDHARVHSSNSASTSGRCESDHHLLGCSKGKRCLLISPHHRRRQQGTSKLRKGGAHGTSVPASAIAGPTAWDGREASIQQVPSLAEVSDRQGPLDGAYLRDLLWQQRRHCVIAGFALVVCTSCNLASPVVTGILFEILVGKQPMSQYPKWLALFAAMYTLEPLLTRVYIKNACAAGEKCLAALRLELFRTLLLQKIEFFDRHSTSDLTSLLSVELDTLRNFVFSNVSRDRGPRAVLECIGAVLVLFALSWRLGPVLAMVIIATGCTAALYKQQTKAVEKAASTALSRMVGIASQAFSSIRTVRSFAGEALERERFASHVSESYQAGMSFAGAKANLESLNRGAVHLSLLALYALGGFLVSQGLMPIRILLSAIGFTFSLVFATQGLVQTLSDVRRVSGSLDRIQDLLSEAQPDPSMAGALPPGAWWRASGTGASTVDAVSTNGSAPGVQPYGPDAGDAAVVAARRSALELREVHFAYPLRPGSFVLRGLDLILPRGSVTAIVGRSGAGKSTVAALLSRFYDPTSGSIYLGGQPATDFTRGEWSRAVALVSQEPVLFAGTIADNIAYGRYGRCTHDEVEAAARAANAHDFIMELPQGYSTTVGDRGTLLSGGQRQRVAIARALLKDSPIIIMDEATSALDVKSERLVQQAVENLVAGRTVLVIAHRLSTVQAAEQIVVLEQGRVKEVGNHQELVRRNGVYADLVSSQSLSLTASV